MKKVKWLQSGVFSPIYGSVGGEQVLVSFNINGYFYVSFIGSNLMVGMEALPTDYDWLREAVKEEAVKLVGKLS